jgi:hypothetical protein
MTIASGSIVLYQFKARTTLKLNTASELENAVASDLGAAGLTVVDFTATTPSIGAEIAALWGYTVQITMKIKTKIDYGQIDDIQSICDHYVYVETDSLPEASTISLGPTPGDVTQTSVSDNTAGGGKKDDGPGFFDSFSTFLKGAGVGGFLGIGLALVAVVLIVSLLTAKKVIPGA